MTQRTSNEDQIVTTDDGMINPETGQFETWEQSLAAIMKKPGARERIERVIADIIAERAAEIRAARLSAG